MENCLCNFYPIFMKRTGIKYLTSWKLGHIVLFTLENLHVLDCWHIGSQVSDRCPLGYLLNIFFADIKATYFCIFGLSSNGQLKIAHLLKHSFFRILWRYNAVFDDWQMFSNTHWRKVRGENKNMFAMQGANWIFSLSSKLDVTKATWHG